MFEVKDSDREVFKQELADFLPGRIFDAHVHISDRASFRGELGPTDYRTKFGGKFEYSDWLAATAQIMPDRDIYANIFGSPDRRTDRDAADRFTGLQVDGEHCFGMALTSPDDSAAEIGRRITANRLIGYKPYWHFVRDKEANDIRIFDMLPAPLLELADERRWIITLHISRAGRLADPVNQRDMVEACRRYPNITFIYAHIGRAYYRSNVEGFLSGLAACPNAWVDTAMVNHEGVLEYTFRNFPRERIVFGSDAPIALLRGKSVEINNQYAYLMGENYAIGTSIHDPQCKIDFTFFYYEQLRAIKLAACAAKLGGTEVENIFFHNAYRLFKHIYTLNYGENA